MSLETLAPWLLLVAVVVFAALLYRFLRARARERTSPVESPLADVEEQYLDSSHIIGPKDLPPGHPRHDGKPRA